MLSISASRPDIVLPRQVDETQRRGEARRARIAKRISMRTGPGFQEEDRANAEVHRNMEEGSLFEYVSKTPSHLRQVAQSRSCVFRYASFQALSL